MKIPRGKHQDFPEAAPRCLSPPPLQTVFLPLHLIMSYMTFKNKEICVTVHSPVTYMFLKKSLSHRVIK